MPSIRYGFPLIFSTTHKIIAVSEGNTVLITTHYIEEAKRAKTVAFMKSGSILKQSNPQMLLETYRCSTLEAVYLYLWKENDKLLANRRRSTQADIGSDAPHDVDLYSDGRRRLSQIQYLKKTIDFKRIYALIWKFYVRTKRFPFFLILFNLVPIIALTAMQISIGQLPYNVPVSVYNGETEPRLSKLYLDLVDKKYIKINEYETRELAIDSIVRGKGIFGIIFEKNFSKTLEHRFQSPFKMTKQELNSSTTTLYADFSETVTGIYAVHYLGEAFLQFGKNVAISLNLNPGFFSIPFNMEAVYGQNFITDNHIEKIKSFADLLLPAALVVIFHLTSMAYSAFLIVYDRKESHLDRFFVAGGQPIEVLISHYTHHLILVSVQVLLSLCCAFSLFDVSHVGSYVEVFAMCVLQSLQGMSIGLFISLILYDEISVAVCIEN